MTKLLKEGEKLTKQNLSDIIIRYRNLVKVKPDIKDKDEKKGEIEQAQWVADKKRYEFALTTLFSALGSDARKQIFEKLDPDTKKAVEKREKRKVATDLEFDKDVPEKAYSDYVMKKVNDAKSGKERINVLRPYLSEEELAKFSLLSTAEHAEMMISNKGETFFKLKQLSLINSAESLDEAYDIYNSFLSPQKFQEKSQSFYDLKPSEIDSVAEDFIKVAAENLTEDELENAVNQINSYVSSADKNLEVLEKAERERQLPHDEKIKFVRDGEEVNKETFEQMYVRFMEYVNRKEVKAPNEKELAYAQRTELLQGDNLRADFFARSINDVLTNEQKRRMIKAMPESAKKDINTILVSRLVGKTDDLYYDQASKLNNMPDGPEKEALTEEHERLEEIRKKVGRKKVSIEEGKRLLAPYVTPEQLNDPLLLEENNLAEDFYKKNAKDIAPVLSQMLTEEQMKTIAKDVDEYKLPWDRSIDEMSKKVYTEQTEKAKTAIDSLTEFDGQPLTSEKKAEIKANLDAANDFLREPVGEDPFSAYSPVVSAYQKASLHDGSNNGENKLKEEGIDGNFYEETIDKEAQTPLFLLKEGKGAEFQKLNNAEYRMSPETKESIKHVFKMMKEYGFCGAGVVKENGIKEYGLSKLAKDIREYKKAIKDGEPERIAKASEQMVTTQKHADEILSYIKENFPIDPKQNNFAMADNIDVTRNDLFPPKYRYDLAVTPFNSLFMMYNFAEANGIDPEEFLERPAHYMKEFYQSKESRNINYAIRGKSGGAALYEVGRNYEMISLPGGYGSSRVFEAFNFLDKDPEIRAYNHGIGNILDLTVVNASGGERNNRAGLYKNGGQHLDRLLYVTEPLKDASILSVPLYNSKTLSFDEAKGFNEFDYIYNNGKSVAEMKEYLDNGIKEYLLADAKARSKNKDDKQGLTINDFLKVAQTAAAKILLAKNAEKNDPAYSGLRAFLKDGQAYVDGLINDERLKNRGIERNVAKLNEDLAKVNDKITERNNALKTDGKNPDEDEILQGLINDRKSYENQIAKANQTLEQNKSFDDINPNMRAASEKKEVENDFTTKLGLLGFTVMDYNAKKELDGVDLAPDKTFNDTVSKLNSEIVSLDERIFAKMNAYAEQKTSGNVLQDDEIQILINQKEKKVAEINRTKTEYLESLEKDVLSGRIPKSFKEARVGQINDPSYKFDSLPDLFPKAELLSKADYIKQLEENGTLKDKDGNELYDENDKNDLYEAYVAGINAERDAEMEDFALRKNAKEFGFTVDNAEAHKAEVKEEVKVDEPKKEEVKRTSYSGRWFNADEKFNKDAFLAKLNEIEATKAAEPQGNNWHEKHQAIEAVENDVERLRYFYDNAFAKLSQEGRSALFETLSDENKKHAVGRAVEQYSKILKDKNLPEAAEVVDKIKKGKYNGMTVAEAEKLASPFLTEEDKKDPLLRPYNHIAAYITDVKGESNLWKPIVENLSEEDLETLAYETESKDAQLERKFDDLLVERYGKETQEVKDIIGGMQNYQGEPLTQERREKIEADLDKAKELTSDLDKDYSGVLGNVRTDREEGKYSMNWERSRVAEEILRSEGIDLRIGGNKSTTTIFNGTGELEVDGYTEGNSAYEMFQVKEGYEEQYQKLRDKKILLSDKTKNSIKAIFAKFDEYGFGEGEFFAEETIKVYALHRYGDEFNKYFDAITSPDPVKKAEAAAAAEKMIIEYNKVKEIIGMAKEAFNIDKGGFYPGNMDAERQVLLPPDIRADLSGVASLNGLYIMYRTLKSQNVNLDEFLNDPRAYLNKETEKVLKTLDPNETVKGKKGAEAIMAIVTPSSEIDNSAKLRLGRAVENISKLETDPEMSRNNMAAEYAYSMTGQLELEVAPHRDELLRCASHHLDRYLMVREPQEDASLMGFPTYDFKTMRAIIPEQFDEVEYLWNLQDTPEEYLDRIVTEGTKVLEQVHGRKTPLMGLTSSDVVHLMQTAAIKYLVVHPELGKNTEAYKGLIQVAQGPSGLENLLSERVNSGKMDIDVDKFNFGSMYQYGVNNTFEEFVKSREIKNFGADVIRADTQANRNFKNLQNEITRAQKEVDRARNDDARRQAQEKLDSAKKALNDAVSARKEQLQKDLEDGKTTESYLARRFAQLDHGKFGDKLPTTFEADRPKTKNEFLSERVDAKILNTLNNVEKQGLYQTYLNGCKREKEIFIAKKYLESEGMIDKPKKIEKESQKDAINAQKVEQKVEQKVINDNKDGKNIADENVEVKEDKKLDKDLEQKPENAKENVDVERISVDVEEENVELDKNSKANEKGKVEEKSDLAKENAPENDGRISIDVEDDVIEQNQDILAFGKEAKKELDQLKK